MRTRLLTSVLLKSALNFRILLNQPQNFYDDNFLNLDSFYSGERLKKINLCAKKPSKDKTNMKHFGSISRSLYMRNGEVELCAEEVSMEKEEDRKIAELAWSWSLKHY